MNSLSIVQANSGSRRLLEAGMVRLAALAPAADLVVFNPLAWPRTNLVTTDHAGAMQDVKTRRKFPYQTLPEGGSCFVAADLPSVGYRSYRRVRPTEPFAPVTVKLQF
jgi:hypothetical protein